MSPRKRIIVVDQRAVKLHLEEGFTQELVASELGVSSAAVYKWTKQYRLHGEAGLQSKGNGAGRSHLPEPVRAAAGRGVDAPGPAVTVPFGTPLEDAERMIIEETLRRTGGNKVRAASLLGISTRTIYRKQAPESPEIE